MKKISFSILSIRTVLLSLCITVIPTLSHAGSWQQNVSIGGFNNVHIYTPDGNSSIGNGKALMLVLHGCVQPISNFLTAKLEDAAEAHGMVIAVPDAMNKAGFSCWSYWQGAKSRSAGDYQNLISLANTMSGDSARNIDANQVYIAGLSSGASFANTTACLAPDVFAGMGISAGPSIGTSSNGALGPCETADVKTRCESYAGSYQSHFDSQITSIAHGDNDSTVNQCYNAQNSDGMAAVYGVSKLSGTNTISEGSLTAEETLWQDGRVSMLWLNGADHAWSGGAGASGGYISSVSINYASYLGNYFAQNNQRVDRNAGPVISNHSVTVNTASLTGSGFAVDAEGSVSNVELTVNSLDSGMPITIQTINTSAAVSDGFYSATSGTLVDGLYQVIAIATDNEGKQGDSVSVTERLGPEPPATAPMLSNIAASVSGQCTTITGSVTDANQNLQSVVVNFSSGNQTASVTGSQYSAEGCSLAGGSNTVFVTATDTTNLTATDSVTFDIDAGVTGDYNLHIGQGHIAWGEGFSACYLEFSFSDFTMREYQQSNGQCQWIADGAPSCKGPEQTCSGGSGGGGGGGGTDSDNDGIDDSIDNCPFDANTDQADNDNDGIGNVCDSTPNGEGHTCSETTASNYSHVSAGRATSSGFYTYAVGSGDNMGLYNLFISSTLAETNAGHYQLGSCP
ncbi:MAG: PHB depolymerase family esterase [Kangiellaceae bacterium]|nr:PHB depolymerase family esterase [Kangiellaceae bacterium]